jgi:hypothetical protein
MMDRNKLLEVIKSGDLFRITTEKRVSMLPGAPASDMVQASTYYVEIGQTLRQHLSQAEPRATGRFLWKWTDIANVVEYNTKRYLLCGIMKTEGRHDEFMGSSSFYVIDPATGEADRSKAYTKSQMKPYLPAAPKFDASYFCKSLDEITDLVPFSMSSMSSAPAVDPLIVTKTERPSLAALLEKRAELDAAIAAVQAEEKTAAEQDWMSCLQSA